MDEKFTVTQSVPSDDGAHVLDCSCSCGGPNVSVSNVHSAKGSQEQLIVFLRNDGAESGDPSPP
ncbi:MAG: hypothetical protein ACN6O5_22025 [Achromobacter sp.]|uniref:hypothetical protein n=1 Tax=Achromobacter sp. TaxID=134375 RepID=UPI003CFC7860